MRTRWAGAGAILGAIAVALFPAPHAHAEEAAAEPDVRVERIVWHGLSALDSDQLEAAIVTTPPAWIDRVLFWRPRPDFREDALERDMRNITDAYAAEGYFEASARYELAWNDAHTRVRVDITVTEGVPVHLESWQLGVPDDAPISPEDRVALQGLLPEPGVIFGSRLYRDTREAVLRRFAEVGHPAAELAGGADVDLAAHVARVAWRAAAGPRVRLGPITVEGLDRVEEKVVRRELRFAEGDRYSTKALSDAERHVYDLGLFRSVEIQAKRPEHPEATPEAQASADTEEIWPVEVRVTERDPRSFRVSVGYGTEDEFRTRVAWIHRNFLGEARRLELRGEYSALLGGGSVELQQLHLFDSDWRGWARVSLFQEDEPAYLAHRLVTGLGVERRFAEYWTFRAGPTFEWGRVDDAKVEDPADPEGPREAFLDSLTLGLRRSVVDDEIDPHFGTRVDLTVVPSARALGSDLNSVEASLEGRAYLPIDVTVLAFRLKAATLEPFAGDGRADVPLYKRFYSGGSMTVRGFDYHRLGPRDEGGHPLGGLSLAEGSVELRFPIWPAVSGLWSHLGGVVFADAGDIGLEPHDWRADDVFYSVGGGIRFATPVGPIRLDVGHVLNPTRFESEVVVHFSVGHTF